MFARFLLLLDGFGDYVVLLIVFFVIAVVELVQVLLALVEVDALYAFFFDLFIFAHFVQHVFLALLLHLQ